MILYDTFHEQHLDGTYYLEHKFENIFPYLLFYLKLKININTEYYKWHYYYLQHIKCIPIPKRVFTGQRLLSNFLLTLFALQQGRQRDQVLLYLLYHKLQFARLFKPPVTLETCSIHTPLSTHTDSLHQSTHSQAMIT